VSDGRRVVEFLAIFKGESQYLNPPSH